MVRRTYDQACPVAHALDVVGERWTLLIVRDLLFGPATFTELRHQLPGLAPNLLSTRLAELAAAGLIARRSDDRDGRVARYALTARGRELGPVVHELARFGLSSWDAPTDHPDHLLKGAVLALLCPERLGPRPLAVHLTVGGEVLWIAVVAGGELRPIDRLRVRVDGDPRIAGLKPQVRIVAPLATLVALRRAELTPADAVALGALDVRGSRRSTGAAAALLGWGSMPDALSPSAPG